MASSSINTYYPLTSTARRGLPRRVACRLLPAGTGRCALDYCPTARGRVICLAAQESTTATVTDKEGAEGKNESEAEKSETPPKPKPAAKATVKALPELMEEEVIPSLKEALESQDDISQIKLSFGDNRLEGSFLKEDVLYIFWAFFPSGLTGPKGFSLSSYGSKVSTVEPFLSDEKKITSNHVVFWVVKRLAAQGILPVWNE